MFKLKPVSYYGFDHEKVAKQFGGDLTFVAEFCVNGEYSPVAVYKAKTPDISKGHKKYMLLQTTESGGLVRGMGAKAMSKYRYQHAVLCLNCDTVLYSINRHHYHTCDCSNETMVDGGRDYLRYGAKDMDLVKAVEWDFLKGKIRTK